jgi:SAM-dependent methyltransferase
LRPLGRTRLATSTRARWRRVRSTLSPPYQEVLEQAVGDAETVLDVGCGVDSPLLHFRRRARWTVGVDAHEAAVAASRAAPVHHDEYRVADVRAIGEEFDAGTFEAVAAFDVLEHLDDDAALELLRAMERIASRRVVVFTPNGFLAQGAVAGNPYQVHRSGWTVDRLRGLGYTVAGVHGVRWLRGEEARIRWRPQRVWHLVSDVTQPVAARAPRLAFQLVAVKEVAG